MQRLREKACRNLRKEARTWRNLARRAGALKRPPRSIDLFSGTHGKSIWHLALSLGSRMTQLGEVPSDPLLWAVTWGWLPAAYIRSQKIGTLASSNPKAKERRTPTHPWFSFVEPTVGKVVELPAYKVAGPPLGLMIQMYDNPCICGSMVPARERQCI